MDIVHLRSEWSPNITRDILAGTVVALALIPEAIAFSFIANVCKVGMGMRFVSRTVVTGFVNALAILIFMAQMPELLGEGMNVYVITAAGLDMRRVGDMGAAAKGASVLRLAAVASHAGNAEDQPAVVAIFRCGQAPR